MTDQDTNLDIRMPSHDEVRAYVAEGRRLQAAAMRGFFARVFRAPSTAATAVGQYLKPDYVGSDHHLTAR
ncbi:MAG: hypothetical protein RIM33_01945 [Alphaproteobacteria bacterium]